MVTEAVRIGAAQRPGEFEPVGQDIGVVLFAAGLDGTAPSASRPLVQVLHGYCLATLRVELLAPAERAPRARAADLALPARRLGEALDWLLQRTDLADVRVGLFGADGAGTLLRVAAEQPARVGAVVLCNGRPELAGDWLPRVQAPTLLIVAGQEAGLLERNRAAMPRLRCNKRLEVVPGAKRRFSEPGALDAVAQLAGAWFARHLRPGHWG